MAQIARSLRKAASLLEAGNNEAARVTLVKILKVQPDHAQAWYLLSFVLQIPHKQICAFRPTQRLKPEYGGDIVHF